MIYGRLRGEYEEMLEKLDVPYMVVSDYRTRCYKESLERRAA
jgi:hypothetical protein